MKCSDEQHMLTDTLASASRAYYSGHPFMSDIEFDHKLEELRKMEDESGVVLPDSPTLNVGAAVVSELKKVRHEYPALSLGKIKYINRDNLESWFDHERSIDAATMMWKCDGSTVVLTYDNGRLTSAATRGDGVEGCDITHNARYFKGVPLGIEYDGHLVVRGEAMMANEEFDRINAEAGGIYENARNLATATIQMLDSYESSKREIIFKAFELVVPDVNTWIGDDFGKVVDIYYNLRFMSERLDWLASLGFDVVEHERVNPDDYLQKIEEWKDRIPKLQYPTDGLVFSYEDLEKGWGLGNTGHHPRWAIALKWTDETVETTVRDIEWSVGKTGLITPVAVFDEVRLGLGSNVTRASLHNISIMTHMPHTNGKGTCICGKGSKAQVYLANMIIPQIASCTEPDPTNESEPIAPETCPSCGSDTRIEKLLGVETLHCDNPNCPAQISAKLMNTFGKNGLFIKGLGESQIEDLLKADLVTSDPKSFYEMANRWAFVFSEDYLANDPDETFKAAVYELLEKDGWGQKKWDNLIKAINESRTTTLQKFIYSLNIPLCGRFLSKELSKFWHDDIDEFVSFVKEAHQIPMEEWTRDEEAYSEGTWEAGYGMLSRIDGIGKEKAAEITNWRDRVTLNCDGWDRFRDFMALVNELKFPAKSDAASDESLKGLTFVITGTVNVYKNRDEFKASVEARGGKVAGSVSKNTNYLVNNDVNSTSGKNAKAKELNIPIISEDRFIEMFGK